MSASSEVIAGTHVEALDALCSDVPGWHRPCLGQLFRPRPRFSGLHFAPIVCVRFDASLTTLAATEQALDLMQVERVAMMPQTSPGIHKIIDLMVGLARLALGNDDVKSTAVSRLKQTGSPALLATFYFTLGLLWRNLAPNHPQIQNTTEFSFKSFQAASDVSQPSSSRRLYVAKQQHSERLRLMFLNMPCTLQPDWMLIMNAG